MNLSLPLNLQIEYRDTSNFHNQNNYTNMSILKKSFSLLSFFIFCATVSIAQTKGLASYYGDAYHGGKTASGEVYDRNKLTGAHKTFPFGTYVKVTRPDNGKSVVIKINDRGPYIKDRVIDVSKKAAERLGLVKDGIAPVVLEKVNSPSSEAVTPAPAAVKTPEPEPKPAPKTTTTPEPKKEVAAPPVKKAEPKPAPTKPKVEKEKPAAASKLKMVTNKNYQNYDLYKIQVMRPAKEGFGVQVGSYGAYENVMKRVAELQEKHFKNILVSVEKGEKGGTVYKIIMGPFGDQKTASAYKRSLSKKHKIKGFTVNLGEIAY